MYFYAEKEKTVEKYRVSYDEELIRKLREEIINNCSLIEHCEYDSAHGPYSLFGRDSSREDNYCIKNYSERFLYVRESRDSLQYPDKDIYHYSYDKYVYPQLVLYIDEFLEGNIQIIGTAAETTNVVAAFKEKIKKLSKEIDDISNLEIKKKQKKLEELKKVTEQAKLNKNQKSTAEYLEKFNNLIRLELVETLSFEEIARVDSFYGRETKYTRALERKRELA